MGHVSAASTILINAEPAAVLTAVGDYRDVRPKILSSHYHDYRVLEGGQGQGTVASWKLQATESRVRDIKASVDVAGHAVIEKGRQLDAWSPTGRWLPPDRAPASPSPRRGRVPAA